MKMALAFSIPKTLAVASLLISHAPALSAIEVDGPAIASESRADNWLSYGRTYSEQRFSPLDEINQISVSRLGLQWYLDLPDARSLQATPLAVDGVLYCSTSWGVVKAVDAASGTVLWTYDPQSRLVLMKTRDAMKINWGTHRGVAFWKGRVYVGTPDGRLVALSAKTGKPVWSVQTFDPKTPRYITGAPRAFNDKIIIGHGGADVGSVRGYVTAYSAATGKQAWRFHVVPGNPAAGFESAAMKMAAATWKGEWWTRGGGGTVWNAMTYDPEFNRIYLGTGNGSPWNQKLRSPGGGDNLFLSSIVALDADTGEYVWHYQTNPGETWDYNASMDIVLATLAIDGQQRKVLMQAPKNGFFYIVDRANGKLISAEQIGKQTWAERVDLATGRPVEVRGARYEDGEALIWPGPGGVHNWQPMSFSPLTGLMYIPTQSSPGYYNDKGIDPKKWRPKDFSLNFGINLADADIPLDGGTSSLLAWDPVNKREAWRVPLPGAWPAGTLVTRGGLVFQGNAGGKFVAYAASSGAKLWEFDAGRGIVAPPISYRVGGRQFISLLVDWSGGAVEMGGGSLFSQHGWTYRGGGRRLLTFALDGSVLLPPVENLPEVPLDVSDFKIDAVLAERGNRLYASTCVLCHSSDVRSGGGAPDLRASAIATSLPALKSVVIGGTLAARGMPQFRDLSEADVEAIYTHIRARARASLKGATR